MTKFHSWGGRTGQQGKLSSGGTYFYFNSAKQYLFKLFFSPALSKQLWKCRLPWCALFTNPRCQLIHYIAGRKPALSPRQGGHLCWRPPGTWAMDKLGEVSVGIRGPLGSPCRPFRVWVLFSVVSRSTSRWRQCTTPHPANHPLRKLTQSGGWSLRRTLMTADCAGV